MPPVADEQQRNLRTLSRVVIALGVALIVVLGALYLGVELPPFEMRKYYTSPTGYAPPPRPVVVPPGTVARGALSLAGPGEEPQRVDGGELRVDGPTKTGSASSQPSTINPPPSTNHGPSTLNPQPPTIERLRNPLADDPETVRFGRRAYTVNCAMCHGEPGQGIGPVGELYTPRPPDLAQHVSQHSEGALYAAITLGIRSTPTPEAARYLPREWHAFRGRTSPKERWAMVTYLRSAFGGRR